MLKHFIMLGIRPLGVRFEKAINTQILDRIEGEDLLLEFALEGLLRGDPATQAEVNAIYRSWGILDGDEIRQGALGLNPMPNGLGAIRLAPINHAPLDLIGTGEALRAGQEQNKKDGDKKANGNDKKKAEAEEAKAVSWNPAFVVALSRLAKSMRNQNGHPQPTP